MLPTTALDRDRFVLALQEKSLWDLIVIGGGATGLGVAVDGASRGLSTLLLEQSDFAKGTSSRSTKLVHGGVRYLARGDIRLVYDALQERGILWKNAPHLVKRRSFIIPCYSLISAVQYFAGLKLYDWLSGRYSFGRSGFLRRKTILQQLPDINPKGLVGGIRYYDGQFDDARLAVNLAQTAAEEGAAVLNYCKVTGLLKENGKVHGVAALDVETQKQYALQAKAVINATGVFVDDILQMDRSGTPPLVQASQGVHVVVNTSFFRGDSAMMIPKTADGRVLFAVPWHDHILLGTTDTPVDHHSIEPKAFDHEIRFILNTVKQYMTKAPSPADVLSVFAGLRPLAAPGKNTRSTQEISRDDKLLVSPSGLITITGGKWTTYRKMAEKTVDKAVETGGLKAAASRTANLRIHGRAETPAANHRSVYGSDCEKIQQLINRFPEWGKRLVDTLPYTEAEVVWAARQEMARTVEDVLARRLRMLFLDARAALTAAPRVAELMAGELGFDEAWQKRQLDAFTILAHQYLPAT